MSAQSGTAARMVEVAVAENGYLEKATNAYLYDKTANAGYNNYTKYNADLGLLNGPKGYWCNSFVSWCAQKAGVSSSVVPITNSCYTTRVFYQKAKRFHLRTSGYTPVAGDFVMFTTSGYPNGTGHIEIVRYVKNGYVYTVGGNTSNSTSTVVDNGGAVCLKYYSLSYSAIYGYCNPAYVEEDDEVVESLNVFDITTKKTVTVNAINKDGTNYIRMRDFSDKLGCEVSYDATKSLPAINTIPLKDTNLVINGENTDLEAVFRAGTNYLPLRAILEMLGVPTDAITWDADTRTITVNGKLTVTYSEE